MPSIRQMIQERSERLRNASSLSPHDIANILLELTSLLSSLNAQIEEASYWYRVLLDKNMGDGSAARAKVKSEASEEFRKVQEQKAQKEALVELIRAAKYAIRAHGEEYQHS